MASNAKKAVVGLGHFIYGWGFIQIALIGMAFFGAIRTDIHGYSGLLLTLAALILFIASIMAKLGGKLIGLSLLLFLILGGQGFFIYSEGLAPIVRGLHPILGLVVMFMGRYIAGQAKAA
ncbi:MAG: hypothetical protein EPO32_11605 [Anaerolineae bacterium]|nr:MAG: hypothetical protein EPO32_11605 [Anaerolineae bacterium]